jgi:tRNA/rRNA methyltransferase
MTQNSFILVEPSVPGNIGAAARALKTMGFNDLRLVNPCDYLNSDETIKFAHGSVDIIEAARVYQDVYEATKDIDLVIGTAAKRRSAVHDYYSCQEIPDLLRKKGSLLSSAGIIFGTEESGLSNEILKDCDIVSYIPMNNLYPSLNLAQAVMIYAYTLFISGIPQESANMKSQDNKSMKALKQKATGLMNVIMDNNDILAGRIMERLMVMGEDDLHLAHSVCNKLIEKLGQEGILLSEENSHS